jgi:hypothetical protein
VLATVFTGSGGYGSPQSFVDGLIPAIWVGVAVLGFGALVVLALPFGTRASARASDAGEAPGGAVRASAAPAPPVAASEPLAAGSQSW